MSRLFPHASTFPLLCSCFSRTSFIQEFLVMQVLATQSTYVGNTHIWSVQHTCDMVYGCVAELDTKGEAYNRQVRSSIALRSLINDCFACINNSISKFWYKRSWTLILHDASPLHSLHSLNAVVVACRKQGFSSFTGKKKLIFFIMCAWGVWRLPHCVLKLLPHVGVHCSKNLQHEWALRPNCNQPTS